MILKAAVIQLDSRIVYVGKRHGDAYYALDQIQGDWCNSEDGFVDAEGNFLNRRDAYKQALMCGQIKPKKDNDPEFCKRYNLLPTDHILTSEDLY